MLRKHISFILFLILLTSTLVTLKTTPVKSQSTITVPDDYPTIQGAINAASDGDTVFVRNGTYSAAIVGKSLILEGENKCATVIEGGTEPYGAGLRILANSVRISNFTIQNARGPPIRVHGDEGPSYCNITICDNIMIGCGEPVRLINTSGNVISDNVIKNSSGGIGFDWANGNIVHNNTLINVGVGIVGGFPSYNNTFYENVVMGNGYAISMNGIFNNNTFYHNSFINNTIQVDISPTMVNCWDDGYPYGGNYWSDYAGVDLHYGINQSELGSDGIGDSAYVIDASNVDNYPLMRLYVPFENQTIYIRADGGVEPYAAPIQRNGSLYTLTDNITSVGHNGIIIERNEIVLDGAGFTLQGMGGYDSKGIELVDRSNVTIRNMKITAFWTGIHLNQSSGNTITGNNLINANWTEQDASWGIYTWNSNSNSLLENTIENYSYGMVIWDFSEHNIISKNTVTGSDGYAIALRYASDNSICANNIIGNDRGIWFKWSHDNFMYHNNLISNSLQVDMFDWNKNFWDNGCEGNYWSDYNGTDSEGDGIGDTPNIIGSSNQDNCPLISPYMSGDINHDAIIDIFDCAKMGLAFSSTPTSPNWNPHCDINEDNLVDILDLVVVAINFSKEWSPP